MTAKTHAAQPCPRWPAEWEPQRAVWLAWPATPADWPGKFTPIPWVFAEIIRALAGPVTVELFVKGEREQGRARGMLARAGADLAHVRFHQAAYDRGWMRDCLPFFVRAGVQVQARQFRFNGWAKYDNHLLDAELGRLAAEAAGHPWSGAARAGRPVVLEGGGLDGNGRGIALTTEECLLDPAVQVRNPGFTKADYEETLRRELGVAEVVWLGRGVSGDDTHGHVDDLCRFVSERRVVLASTDDESHPDFAALKDNAERLDALRLADGGKLEVVRLPMPSPLVFEGMMLPASYANFLISNECVLVPTFNDPKDRLALGILAELFPERTVRGIHAVDLVWGLGTVHCLSHEEPLAAAG